MLGVKTGHSETGGNMRTLFALAILACGMLAMDAAADAASRSKSKRGAKAAYVHKGKVEQARADLVCAERARHEDPSGRFAGYPCWARESFALGANIDTQ